MPGDHSAPRGLPMKGVLISTPVDSDRAVQRDTVQCCHCGRIWLWQPGSGRRRGFCTLCGGLTCGTGACDRCVPMEQMIENMEAGLPYELACRHKPIRVSVPGIIKP
ncbi:MAG: hypothetical protein IT429_16975 [Gemmataceae bacterium]|nr:hypothetical protein [Gemmataceae bacterium]